MTLSFSGNRLLSKDLTRILATFLVVLGPHTAYELLVNWQLIPASFWVTADIYDSVSLICVPLFIMVSGSLLLNKREDAGTFYKKRFVRVVIPFLTWVIIYVLWRIFYKHESLSAAAWLREIFKGPVYYHLWFLYMIVGLYAITPLLRHVVQKTGRGFMTKVILAWFFLASPGAVGHLSHNRLLGGPHPLHLRRLRAKLFLVDILLRGLLPAGAHLASDPVKSNHWPITLSVAFICPLLSAFLMYSMSLRAGTLVPFPDFIFVTISLAAVATFLLLEHFFSDVKHAIKPGMLAPVTELAGVTFGIYLIHPIVRDVLSNGDLGFCLSASVFNPALAIPFTALMVFCISALICLMIIKVPLLRSII